MLKEFPLSGKVPEEIEDSRYREIVVGPCRIFYRLEGDLVFILYVMRGERALRNFILQDRADKTVNQALQYGRHFVPLSFLASPLSRKRRHCNPPLSENVSLSEEYNEICGIGY